MKKIISIILVCAMLVLCIGGCGDSSSKKVELVWATIGNGGAELDIVLQEFNERLETLLPNTTVKFVTLDQETWPLWMSEGKQIDIAWSGYMFDTKSEIKKGSYLALDELIEQYAPNIQKEMKDYESEYKSGNLDGSQYMIPNQQARITQSPALEVPASLWKYMDVDALLAALNASPYLTEDILKVIDSYLEKVYASGEYDTDMVTKYISISYLKDCLLYRGYDTITSGFAYAAWEENPEIVCLYETEQFKLFTQYASKWREKGYISEEVAGMATASSRNDIISGHSTSDWYATTVEGRGEERGVFYTFDDFGGIKSYKILVNNMDQMYNGVYRFANSNTYLTIPYTSENPERAMQLLDLLRSPVGTEGNDLLNLLCYGFEQNSEEAKEYDTYHYTLNEDGTAQGVDYTVQPSNSSKYGFASWIMGNALLAYITPDLVPGVAEYVIDYNANVKPNHHQTKYYGFSFDSEPVRTEIANFTTVSGEYLDRVAYGQDGANTQSVYNTMIEKMKSAGLETIKKEIQKQADEYLSNK